ncbi:MAG: PspC domain-containing protein [Cryomorphaceae bacterium]|nr:PspC domain-containing protein [Cryomorphaceae bacterium]
MNFLIEEEAYECLKQYMDKLAHVLKNDKGGKEIIEDIELRIAELCTAKLNDRKQVIDTDDIKSILDTLGDPSQFIDEDKPTNEDSFHSTKDQKQSSDEKRLFRDLENASIAGVCSGIANYLNIDVVIVRAIFLVIFFFGGFGLPMYFILWI